MKNSILWLIVSIVFVALSPYSWSSEEVSNDFYQLKSINIPRQLDVDGQVLQLHGAGIRSVLLANVYSLALFLPETDQTAKDIIESNQSLIIRIYITSRLITAKRFEKQIRSSYVKVIGDYFPEVDKRLDQLLEAFSQEFKVGDVWDLRYRSTNQTIDVFYNNEQINSVEGAVFKQALLSIWLSDRAIQKSLRRELLTNPFG